MKENKGIFTMMCLFSKFKNVNHWIIVFTVSNTGRVIKDKETLSGLSLCPLRPVSIC